MVKMVSSVLIALFAVGACQYASAAYAEVCERQAPADVLTCISLAHAARDSSAYASILDGDFTVRSHGAEWGLDKELLSTGAFFRNPDIAKISLEFEDGYSVLPAEDRDVWQLQDVDCTLSIYLKDGRIVEEERKNQEFWVRKDSDGNYRVFRYLNPDGD